MLTRNMDFDRIPSHVFKLSLEDIPPDHKSRLNIFDNVREIIITKRCINVNIFGSVNSLTLLDNCELELSENTKKSLKILAFPFASVDAIHQ